MEKKIKRLGSSLLSCLRPPVLDLLIHHYDISTLKHDLSAGVTVFILLIPQGLAYSLLAGTPPVYGLYTAAMPLIAYSIFGTSRQLAIGPMAIASLLSASAVGSLKNDDGELLEEESDEWVEASVTLAFLTGVVMMGLAVMGVGDHISRCLSGSVLSGFTTGAACIIFLSQVSKLLGMSLERKAYSHQSIAAICTHFDDLSVAALLIGLVTALSLFAVKHWRMQQKKLREEQAGREAQEASSSGSGSGSGSVLMTMVRALSRFSLLLACISTTVLSWALHNYSSVTLPVIGSVPRGLKSPAVPTLTSSLVLDLLPGAFTIAVITFAGNWAVSRKIADHLKYEVVANKEIMAYSVSNLVGSLFSGIAAAAALARTAANMESGAQTQVAGIVSGICMIFALQFFTTLFYYMPVATLAAVIMVPVMSMMDFWRMRVAYRCGFYVDFVIMIGTALCTFFAGAAMGLLCGVVLSVGSFLISTSSSDFDTTTKKTLQSKPPQAVSCLDSASAGKVVIFRMSSILYFGNLDRFKSSLKSTCRALVASVLHDYHCSGRPDSCSSSSSKPVVHAAIVLDAKSWGHYIELPTVLAMEELREDFLTSAPGSSSAATVVRVHLGIVNCHPYVLERLEAYGLSKKMGEEFMFEDEGECWSRCGGALEKLDIEMNDTLIESNHSQSQENGMVEELELRTIEDLGAESQL